LKYSWELNHIQIYYLLVLGQVHFVNYQFNISMSLISCCHVHIAIFLSLHHQSMNCPKLVKMISMPRVYETSHEYQKNHYYCGIKALHVVILYVHQLNLAKLPNLYLFNSMLFCQVDFKLVHLVHFAKSTLFSPNFIPFCWVAKWTSLCHQCHVTKIPSWLNKPIRQVHFAKCKLSSHSCQVDFKLVHLVHFAKSTLFSSNFLFHFVKLPSQHHYVDQQLHVA